MSQLTRITYLITVLLILTGYTRPARALETRPFLSLEMVKTMADACEAKAKVKGWKPVNIAIFDAGGNLKLFRRQNDAYLGSIDIAQLKGRSSVLLPFPTRYLGENIAYKDPRRPHGIELIPGIVVFPGGLPIKNESGQLMGGIGVSGATSDQDEECAMVAIEAIVDQLKESSD